MPAHSLVSRALMCTSNEAQARWIGWVMVACGLRVVSCGLWVVGSYLFHDPSLALREGNVPTRLVLDELDVNLSPLAPRLIIVVVVVIGCRTHARAFDATSISAIAGHVVVAGRSIGVSNVGHLRDVTSRHLSLLRWRTFRVCGRLRSQKGTSISELLC